MATLDHIVVTLAVLATMLLSTTTEATDYVVGDASGWTLDFYYQAWANSKTFKVGDNLVFDYTQGEHNVFQVADDAFANCIIPPGKIAYTSGHDIIELSSPGKEYFICGVAEHCSAFNQKLAVDVKPR